MMTKELPQKKFSRHGGDFFATGVAHASRSVDWTPTSVVLERFQLTRRLGHGGQAEVWQAYDLVRNELVALKRILPDLLQNQNERTRFFREMSTLPSLIHPNIVTIHDVYPEHYFYSMEHIAGQTLRELLNNTKQPLSLQQAVTWGLMLVDALQFVHQKGLTHRDIKPENIMIVKTQEVKLIDFGIALAENNARLTTVHGQVGTPYYMAPEQIEGKESLTTSADIFSLGVVFFEMLTLSLPHAYFSLPELRPDLPKTTLLQLETLFQGTLHRQANKRNSLASLRQQLQALQVAGGVVNAMDQVSDDEQVDSFEKQDESLQDYTILSNIPKRFVPHALFLLSNGDKKVTFFSGRPFFWQIIHFLLFLFFFVLSLGLFSMFPQKGKEAIWGGLFFLVCAICFGFLAFTKKFWILTDVHFYSRSTETINIPLADIETVRLKDNKLIFIKKEKNILGFSKKIEIDGVIDADIFHQKLIRQLEEMQGIN
jgi:serine/threonine protein kinase